MRTARFILVCLLAATALTAGLGAAAVPYAEHLRPTHAEAERLLRDGFSRSSTFRHLVDRIRRSDVIVYVQLRPDMPRGAGGSLRFIGCSATNRFLMVSINTSHSWPAKIALLGHELQHATEVADATDVTSADGLRALYRRIGVRVRADAYDSHAAQVAGQVVRAELSGPGRDGIVATHAGSHGATAIDDALLIGGASIQ
jgi:hypothetical protein